MLGGSVHMHAGHATPNRDRCCFIPVSTILDKVGHDLYESLPAAHALTGCDTMSSFFKVGKHTVYTRLMDYIQRAPDALKTFGLSGSVTEDISAARAYVLNLWKTKDSMPNTGQIKIYPGRHHRSFSCSASSTRGHIWTTCDKGTISSYHLVP